MKPDTSYIIVARAENSNGLSVPSGMSKVMHTLPANSEAVPQYQLDEARTRLGTKVVVLKELIPTASTAVKISWVVSNLDYLLILYTLIFHNSYIFILFLFKLS